MGPAYVEELSFSFLVVRLSQAHQPIPLVDFGAIGTMYKYYLLLRDFCNGQIFYRYRWLSLSPAYSGTGEFIMVLRVAVEGCRAEVLKLDVGSCGRTVEWVRCTSDRSSLEKTRNKRWMSRMDTSVQRPSGRKVRREHMSVDTFHIHPKLGRRHPKPHSGRATRHYPQLFWSASKACVAGNSVTPRIRYTSH